MPVQVVPAVDVTVNICSTGLDMKNHKSEPEEVSDGVNYYWEADRLKTFSNWPFNKRCKCNPTKMAEAGFYACGSEHEKDLAKCYFCNKELDGWEPTDDPWVEHRKHSDNCVFVKYGRPEAELTIEEHLELIQNFMRQRIEAYYEKKMKKLREEIEDILLPME